MVCQNRTAIDIANETREQVYTASIGFKLSKWNSVFEKKTLAEKAIRPSQ